MLCKFTVIIMVTMTNENIHSTFLSYQSLPNGTMPSNIVFYYTSCFFFLLFSRKVISQQKKNTVVKYHARYPKFLLFDEQSKFQLLTEKAVLFFIMLCFWLSV